MSFFEELVERVDEANEVTEEVLLRPPLFAGLRP